MTVLEEARHIAARVRDHKGAIAHHRRQLKREARRLEDFCRANGIELELVTQTEEGHSHDTQHTDHPA